MRIRRLHFWLLAAVLVVAARPVQAAEVDKYLPDDTGVVFTLNVNQIVTSDLVKKHFLEKVKELLKEQSDATKILEQLGFDPFKDLTSITTTVPSIEKEPKAYIIAHGQFDVAKLTAAAEEHAKANPDALKIHKEGNVTSYEVNPPNSNKPMFVGIVDKTTIVASSEKEFIADSFARASGQKKSMLKKDVQEMIEKVDGKQSVWAVIPGSVLATAQLPEGSDEKAKKIVEKIDGISMGATVGKDIKFGLSMVAKSADGAKELAEEMKKGIDEAQGVVPFIVQTNKALAPLADVIGALKVETKDKTVSINSEVSDELIEKALKDQ